MYVFDSVPFNHRSSVTVFFFFYTSHVTRGCTCSIRIYSNSNNNIYAHDYSFNLLGFLRCIGYPSVWMFLTSNKWLHLIFVIIVILLARETYQTTRKWCIEFEALRYSSAQMMLILHMSLSKRNNYSLNCLFGFL